MTSEQETPRAQEDTYRNILIVDDEPPIRELLEVYLTDHGYNVTCAASGAEALRIAGHHPIHLIISDLILADTDGVELLKQLKESHPHRPVILMSGYSDADPMMHAAKQAGACAWISKTNPLSEIVKCVKRALKGDSPSTGGLAETAPNSGSASG